MRKFVEVILTKDVENVGMKGQIQKVARGFAKNFLIPQNLAQFGTKDLIAAALKNQEEIQKRQGEEMQKAQELKEKLESAPLTFEISASKDETLYGSVTKQDVVDQIKKSFEMDVDKKNVFLPQSIKKAGQYTVTIKLFQNIRAKTKLVIKAVISNQE